MGATDWHEQNNQLTKTFVFGNFIAAMHFVNSVGRLAEQQNHHPEILIEYNKVTIKSWTHDAGNVVTEKDKVLARAIEELVE